MGILNETRFVERLRFFNGQRLFASDLQGLEAFNREMRWLHNASLHQPGIGSGLAVYGKKGERQVTIKPGYAIDALGREIVLTRDLVEPVPPVSSEQDGRSVLYDLTISYPDDDALEEAETREGVCLPRGVVRLREEPVLCWVRLERDDQDRLHARNPQLGKDIESGLKLVLTRVEVLNCQLEKDLSIAERRSARPAKQPHIACGEARPDPWQVRWLINEERLKRVVVQLLTLIAEQSQNGDGSPLLQPLARSITPSPLSRLLCPIVLPIGIEAVVDTRCHGFRTIPCYNARMEGIRPHELNLVEVAEKIGLINLEELGKELGQDSKAVETLENGIYVTLYTDAVAAVTDGQRDKFTLQAALMVQLLDVPDPAAIQQLFSNEAFRVHVESKFLGLSVVKQYKDCEGKTGEELSKCLNPVADQIISMTKGYFEMLLVPADWAIVWMGIES